MKIKPPRRGRLLFLCLWKGTTLVVNVSWKGYDFTGCGKNSILLLILGGAAVYRCDNRLVLFTALAAEVCQSVFEALFPQTV
jgi:hypothetical protein